jgi:NAD(P)-dependent dehydrogenase (short-subunit alcohol dehydrogenase family)
LKKEQVVKLKDQVALVTGASRGIGRAIALALAKEGADVIITGRDVDLLAALQAEIEAGGARCSAAIADLADRDAAGAIWAHCQKSFGRVDILVNNAGIGSSANPKPVINFDDDFWELTLYVNLTVPYLLCKEVLPGMTARHYGRIINVASINGRVGSVHGAAYAASKHGLMGLTRTLALEVAKDGITVNAICPGPVRTLINDKRIAYDAERLGKSVAEIEAGATPLGRRLEAAEIAPLAVYLASPEAAVVNGQGFNIDGGLVMS